MIFVKVIDDSKILSRSDLNDLSISRKEEWGGAAGHRGNRRVCLWTQGIQ